MLGFWYEDGTKVTVDVLRRTEFVTGKAKMQYASRGVVELADGTVRIFGVRHKPDRHGHYHTVGEAGEWQDYESTVAGLRRFEEQWITEELPEYVRDTSVLPVQIREEPRKSA
ncbi:hypothetical protein [Streptomyces sp. 5-10]|uniref:hypothetical protein n=1 Tax=Streptomyces sp. 5-10 TaxID=878925 RepID=UPI00168C0408|nr:hypothetical protein [Streptomyces sp. 5-10]MBD3004601.1 hypothetical protein [Streptomyces sp. 5-10]